MLNGSRKRAKRDARKDRCHIGATATGSGLRFQGSLPFNAFNILAYRCFTERARPDSNGGPAGSKPDDPIEQHKNPSAFRIPARNQTVTPRPPWIGTKIGT
jgi:hypothetical protein